MDGSTVLLLFLALLLFPPYYPSHGRRRAGSHDHGHACDGVPPLQNNLNRDIAKLPLPHTIAISTSTNEDEGSMVSAKEVY